MMNEDFATEAHPEQIGPYRLIEVLGHGGMGIVYHGIHESSAEAVALKTIRTANESILESIRREIWALAQIKHPGIVRIIDDGIYNGFPWYAMQLLDGSNLRDYFSHSHASSYQTSSTAVFQHQGIGDSDSDKTGFTASQNPVLKQDTTKTQRASDLKISDDNDSSPAIISQTRFPKGLEIKKVLTLIRKICEPLSFIHGEGIVHLDLKPENIVIRESGEPVLVDFGLVTRFSGEESRERLDFSLSGAGTINYMAPEQIRSEYVDARTDLYALGCILYELLTTFPPFFSPIPSQIIQAHLHATPQPPSKFRTDIEPGLEKLVLRLLAKDPVDRIGHAGAIAAQLAKLNDEPLQSLVQYKAKPYLYRGRLAGRTAPFEQLLSTVQELQRGQGGIVLVTGESGVGKTRLVYECSKHVAVDKTVVLYGECLEHNQQSLKAMISPLKKIVDRCYDGGRAESERVFGNRGKVLSAYESSIASLPGQNDYPVPEELPLADARLRLYRSLLDTFLHFCDDGELFLIIDDLHWADELVIGFLDFFNRQIKLEPLPIVIACTYRSEVVTPAIEKLLSDDEIFSIQLSRLDDRAVQQMISDMLALKPAPDVFCKYLTRHSEGNPLFVAEYLRAAVEQELLYRDEWGDWQIKELDSEQTSHGTTYTSLPLPRSIHGLIGHRLKKLSALMRRILGSAAIIGKDFHIKVLLELHSLDEKELMPVLRDLEVRQLIEKKSSLVYTFTHARIQDVAVEGLRNEDRQALHSQVAVIMEKLFHHNLENYYHELAFHWYGALNYLKACSYYHRAAKQSMKLHELENSTVYYQHALDTYDLLSDKESQQLYFDKSDLFRERGDVFYLMARYDDAFLQLKQSLAICSDNLKQALCREKLGQIESIRGNTDGSRKEIQKALALTTDDPLNHVKIMVAQSHLEAERCGQYNRAEKINEEALTLLKGKFHFLNQSVEQLVKLIKDDEHLTPPVDLYFAVLKNKAAIAMYQSDVNEALSLFKEIYRYYKNRGDVFQRGNTANNLGNVYYFLGMYDKSLLHYKEFLHLGKKMGFRQAEANASCNIGLIYSNMGDFTNAREYFENGHRLMAELGDKRGVGMSTANLGIIDYYKGDYKTALNHFLQWYDISREIGDKHGLAMAAVNISTIYRITSDYELSHRFNMEALEVSQEIGDLRAESLSMINLAIWSMDQKQYDKAFDYFEKTIVLCKQNKDKTNLALAYGMLGYTYYKIWDLNNAKCYFNKQLEIGVELGENIPQVRALIKLGLFDLYQGNFKKTRQQLLESIALSEKADFLEGLEEGFAALARLNYITDNAAEFFETVEKAITYNNRNHQMEATKLCCLKAEYELDCNVLENMTQVSASINEYLKNNKSVELHLRLKLIELQCNENIPLSNSLINEVKGLADEIENLYERVRIIIRFTQILKRRGYQKEYQQFLIEAQEIAEEKGFSYYSSLISRLIENR